MHATRRTRRARTGDDLISYAVHRGGMGGRGGVGGVTDRPVTDRPLAGLLGHRIAERFRAWTGRSGRRYIFSVFPLDDAAGDLGGLPVGDHAVVIAVERRADGARQALWIAETGPCSARFLSGDGLRAMAGRPGVELHVHLLAASVADRRAIVDDLGFAAIGSLPAAS